MRKFPLGIAIKILAALFISNFAVCEVHSGSVNSTTPRDFIAIPADQGAAWEKEFLSQVKVLSHPIDTFHWTSMKKIDEANKSEVSVLDQKGPAYLDKYLNDYHSIVTKPLTNLFAGPGLYLASDPVATIYYSGLQNWGLLKVPFKSGTKFIDIREHTFEPFSKEARAELTKLHCEATSVDEMTRLPHCHELFVQMTDRHGISIIAYTYSTAQFPGLPERPSTCFVLTSKIGIDWVNFKLLNAKTDKKVSNFDRSLITEAIFQYLENPGHSDKEKQEYLDALPWGAMDRPSKATFQNYAAQHYFGAGNYPEDLVSNDARGFLSQYSKIEARAAEVGRQIGKNIDPLRFKFLIRDFYPPAAADDNRTPFSQLGTLVLAPDEIQEKWRTVSTAKAAARISAMHNDPLTINLIQTWVPGLKLQSPQGNNGKENLEYLQKQLSEFDALFRNTESKNRILDLLYQQLDHLNYRFPFDRAKGTVGSALVTYVTTRARLPPTFINQGWFRTEDYRYRKITSEAYRRMLDCLGRWEREPVAQVQFSECGLVGE